MPDILNARAERATDPRSHPVFDQIVTTGGAWMGAILAAGRAATLRRNRHHAQSAPLRQQLAEIRAMAAPEKGHA